MFLYITLFFQNVLGFSPFEAGLRSLPVTAPILFVSPLSGRLTARVPVRLLLGTGLAFVTVGLVLMGNLSDSSGWTALVPGQILAGIGIGLATPALASTAVGVVDPQLSGMASGASNTARQLGLATGIAGLGSIFQSKIESTLTPLVAGMPASSHVHELARAVASGGTGRALQAVPPADRDKVVARRAPCVRDGLQHDRGGERRRRGGGLRGGVRAGAVAGLRGQRPPGGTARAGAGSAGADAIVAGCRASARPTASRHLRRFVNIRTRGSTSAKSRSALTPS